MDEELDAHRGLGLAVASPWDAPVLVVDPRLTAPRGAAASAGAMLDEEQGALDDGMGGWDRPDAFPQGEPAHASSVSTPIDPGNRGYQLLCKLGWTAGKGLGRQGQGILEPVQAGVEAGVRLGLGKQAQDDAYTNADGIVRKRLEVEIQADEDEARRSRREAQVQRDEAIKQDVTQILRTFLCQVCNKQYATAMELEEHLSSYDHHHRKRLAEARQAELERTRDERLRKEQRRQQREAQRLEDQIRKAREAAGGKPPQPEQPPLPPGLAPPLPPGDAAGQAAHAAPPPPPPQALPGGQAQVAAVSFGLRAVPGRGPSLGLGRGGAAAGRRPGVLAGRGAGRRPAKVSAAFAESSSDEEAGA